MIIKLTLIGLVIVLISVIIASYYVNKEGFDNISNLPKELSSAVNTVSPRQLSEESSIPTRTDVVPEVSISGTGYDAMNLQQRAELLKDIQKIVRNEVLASRSTTPISTATTPISTATNDMKSSDAMIQGQEYSDNCSKDTDYRCPKNPDGSCPPIPDMSEYIKKDQIPCWGCSLDY